MMTFIYVGVGFIAGVLCTLAVTMKGDDACEDD